MVRPNHIELPATVNSTIKCMKSHYKMHEISQLFSILFVKQINFYASTHLALSSYKYSDILSILNYTLY